MKDQSVTLITQKFSFHVDAKLFAFKWNDAQYIDVEYNATNAEDKLVVYVTNISAQPYLLGMIIVHNNWMVLTKAIEDAARHNAEEYFQEKENYEADRQDDHCATITEVFNFDNSHFI